MDMPIARASTGASCILRRRQQGFTLVEVVIAAGLIGFLALTATFFWVDSFGLVRTVNTDSAAIADGRALLERLAREIREVKYNPSSGAYCVSTMSAMFEANFSTNFQLRPLPNLIKSSARLW